MPDRTAAATGIDEPDLSSVLYAPADERSPTDIRSPVDALLAAARQHLRRLTPIEAHAATRAGALLVDTRTAAQRAVQGELPGAVVIDRTVLEWRLDPTSESCIPEASTLPEIIVVCRQGYSSSLAAASLQAIGLSRATDMVGGVEAWVAAGLPVHTGPVDVRP